MFAWLALVGTLRRSKVATLLSRPGTGTAAHGASAVETGVLPRSFSELTLRSGVCTAR